MRYPAINDITTTPENPPMFVTGNVAEKRFPPAFVRVHERHYGDLKPLHSTHTTAEIMQQIATHATKEHWNIVIQDVENGLFQAVAITRLLRFRDDIVVRIEDTGTERVVHVRSRSRLGKGDLGANYLRICKLFSAMQP